MEESSTNQTLPDTGIKILFVIGLIVFLGFIAYEPYKSVNKKVLEKDSIIVKLQQPEFLIEDLCDSVLYQALVYYKIQEPEIVLAQAKLETGNYHSILCKEHNNIFGLYNIRTQRYLKFDHWSECILAYKEKIECKRNPNENYYKFLDRIGYAEDPEYISKIKKLVNNGKTF